MKTLLTLLLAMAATAAHASAPPYFGTTMSTQTGTATQYLSGNFCVAASSLTAGTCAAQVDGRNATITATTFAGALSGNAATVTTNANLTGGVTSVGNAATVVTNANLTGDVTSVGNATTAAATQANIATLSKSGGVSVTGAGGLAATYGITAGSVTTSGPNGFIVSASSINGGGFFGDGSHLAGVLPLTGGALTNTLNINKQTTSTNIGDVESNAELIVKSGGTVRGIAFAGDSGSYTPLLQGTAGGASYQIGINPYGGNVGVGTISPGSILDVNGATTIRGPVTASTVNVTGTGNACFNAGGFIIDCTNKSLTGVAGSSVTINGNGMRVISAVNNNQSFITEYGAGTGITAALGINAGGAGYCASIYNQGTSQSIMCGGGTALGTYAASATNPPANSLIVGGNVGIGTTNPATLLDVNGAAQFGSGATKSTFTATGALTMDPVANIAVGRNTGASGRSIIGNSSAGDLAIDGSATNGPVYINNFSNGNVSLVVGGGNVVVATGANIIYRCSVAGTLRIGQLTTVSADCGTAVDTKLRLP